MGLWPTSIPDNVWETDSEGNAIVHSSVREGAQIVTLLTIFSLAISPG